jgi:YD repeat-containing protein
MLQYLLKIILISLSFVGPIFAYQNPTWMFSAEECSKVGALCVPPVPTEWRYLDQPVCSGERGLGVPESEGGEAVVLNCSIALMESLGMPPQRLGSRCSQYTVSAHGWKVKNFFSAIPNVSYSEVPDSPFIKYISWDIASPTANLTCIGNGEVTSTMYRIRFLRCPSGFIGNDGLVESPNIRYCYRYSEQQPVEKSCSAAVYGDGGGAFYSGNPATERYQDGLLFGNPVETATGERFQVEYDWIDPSGRGLSVARLYRTDWAEQKNGLIGNAWQLSFSAYLNSVTSNQKAIRLPDGSLRRFTADNSVSPARWIPSGHASTLTWIDLKLVYEHAEDGSRWVFQDGLLQEVIYRNGWRRSYFYSFGKISKIQDQFGRQIEISYGANGPVSILTPGGGVVRYVYGESGNLSQVIYPDGSSRSYAYIDSENYPLLAKIYDENGVVFSEFA